MLVKRKVKNIIPFSWFGGKFSHLEWLLPIINKTPHKSYVEPYGGSGVVLLNKNPSPIETYNDFYEDVTIFFKVLRDYPEEIIRQITFTPYSRKEFENCCSSLNTDSSIDKARKFFVRARQVWLGLATTATPGKWCTVYKQSNRGMSMVVSRWLSAIDGLDIICARLKEVQIENLDALEILKRYDNESTLFYIDPPYMPETRSSTGAYFYEMKRIDHIKLLNKLQSIKGKVLISGYMNSLYNESFSEWYKYLPQAKKVRSTNTNNNKHRASQEVLWGNYDFLSYL